MVDHNLDRKAEREPDEPETPSQIADPNRHQSPLEQLLLKLEEQISCCETDQLPSHLRPFQSQEQYELVRCTHRQLLHSGFYWGATSIGEAHLSLAKASVGTFLIRDSSQPDVFFTLSYRSQAAPTSVRVLLEELSFRLSGSYRRFPSLFALLAHYSSTSCKLTVPLRHQRPEPLKQMCRRSLVRALGAEALRMLPGLSADLRDFVDAYPYAI